MLPRTPSSSQAILAILAFLSAGLWANAASAADPCPRTKATGKNYSGQNLENQNFANQDLKGANFTGAKLVGTVFTGANLQGADFTNASMGTSVSTRQITTFSRANLKDACFSSTTVLNTDFQFADLSCTVFDNTDLLLAVFGPVIRAASTSGDCRTTFSNSGLNCEFIPQWKDLDLTQARVQTCWDKLVGVDFSGGWMNRVIFSGLNLNSTTWKGAKLRGAYFLNAKLRNAVFSGADLRQAQLSQADATQATFDVQAQLSGAHLSGVVLQGANLTSAVLQAADGLPAVDLSLAFMADAVFTDAKLSGVNFSHANFYGALAKADNANLQQVDLTNANLGSVNLSQGLLKGAKLDASVLANASLRGADLSPSDFVSSSLVKANLQGTDFSGAKLFGANLSNAAVALADGVPLFKTSASLAADLDRRELTAEVVEAFTLKGQRLVDCENPSVLVDVAGKQWQIWVDSLIGPNLKRFNKFSLKLSGGAINVSGLSSLAPEQALFTIPATYSAALDKKQLASGLLQAFREGSYPLPPCRNPSINVKTPGNRWTLYETLSLITVAGLGYTGFQLTTEGSDIHVYGAQVTVIRPAANGSLTLVPLPVQPTLLTAAALDDNTTCPNQKSYGANRTSGATWEEMMTAVAPPPPPACIPSPTTWCTTQ